MKNSIITAALAICIVTSSMAITVDADRYFSYLNKPSGTILLSKQSCSLADYAQYKWKHGWFYEPGDDVGIDSCWRYDAGSTTIILVCFVHKERKEPLGPCILASKELFLNTTGLPSRANFN